MWWIRFIFSMKKIMYFVNWNLVSDIDIPWWIYRMNGALIKGFVPKERSCQNSEVRIQYLCRTPNIWLKLTCWSWWKLSFDRNDTFLPNALFFNSLLIDSDKPSLKYSLLMFSPLNYMHFFQINFQYIWQPSWRFMERYEWWNQYPSPYAETGI